MIARCQSANIRKDGGWGRAETVESGSEEANGVFWTYLARSSRLTAFTAPSRAATNSFYLKCFQ